MTGRGAVARIGPIAAVAFTDKGQKTAISNGGGAHHAEHIDGAPRRAIRRFCPLGIQLEHGGRIHGQTIRQMARQLQSI
jgi:hypothetical protein